MKRIAVIIKHRYRDYDYRVDVYEVPEDVDYDTIRNDVEARMIGPFEILAISDKVDLNCKLIQTA